MKVTPFQALHTSRQAFVQELSKWLLYCVPLNLIKGSTTFCFSTEEGLLQKETIPVAVTVFFLQEKLQRNVSFIVSVISKAD